MSATAGTAYILPRSFGPEAGKHPQDYGEGDPYIVVPAHSLWGEMFPVGLYFSRCQNT